MTEFTEDYRRIDALILQELRNISSKIVDNSTKVDWNRRHLEWTTEQKKTAPKKVAPYGFKVFSQADEDGLIDEIFKRIGTTNKFFVEFGVGDGSENNTLFLLLQGWHGVWLDGSDAHALNISILLKPYLDSQQLKFQQTIVTYQNINQLLSAQDVPEEIDLLSIDVDGQDIWIWHALTVTRPRVVAIEYNPMWRPPLCVGVPPNIDHMWDHTNYQGASLNAIDLVAQLKGYKLVGCSFSGANAFYIRADLVDENLFHAPFTPEEHYQKNWANTFDVYHKFGDKLPIDICSLISRFDPAVPKY